MSPTTISMKVILLVVMDMNQFAFKMRIRKHEKDFIGKDSIYSFISSGIIEEAEYYKKSNEERS